MRLGVDRLVLDRRGDVPEEESGLDRAERTLARWLYGCAAVASL